MEFNLIDTHTHLYAAEFDADREICIQRALDAGVSHFMMPNCESSTILKMLSLCEKHPEKFFPMIGLHPCSVKEDYETELACMASWLKKHKFYAIGEIGMDLHWDTTYKKEQEIAFKRQIDWSIDYKLPIVIHARNSFEEIFDILSDYKANSISGIFHCFSGNLPQAQKIIEMGLSLGIGGVVTFKNAGLDKVIRALDLEHLVLETDAPYLSPVPYRGKRNESSYLPFIAEKIAQLKDVTVAHVAKVTTENARAIFNC
jgi:TatD DNase family protein